MRFLYFKNNQGPEYLAPVFQIECIMSIKNFDEAYNPSKIEIDVYKFSEKLDEKHTDKPYVYKYFETREK